MVKMLYVMSLLGKKDLVILNVSTFRLFIEKKLRKNTSD